MCKDNEKNVTQNSKFVESIQQLVINTITDKIEYDKLDDYQQKIHDFIYNALNDEFDIEHYLLNAIVDLSENGLHSELNKDTINGIACMREYANFVNSLRNMKFS